MGKIDRIEQWLADIGIGFAWKRAEPGFDCIDAFRDAGESTPPDHALNGADLVSMPVMMAQAVANGVGGIYPFFAPAVGAMGAFIAGSNTVSNLMLAEFQFSVAETLGLSTAMMVALQAVGAAAGNMIAIHNVVAASATVGLLGREGTTIRKTIIPTIYYLVFAGIIALIAFYVLGVTDPLM